MNKDMLGVIFCVSIISCLHEMQGMEERRQSRSNRLHNRSIKWQNNSRRNKIKNKFNVRPLYIFNPGLPEAKTSSFSRQWVDRLITHSRPNKEDKPEIRNFLMEAVRAGDNSTLQKVIDSPHGKRSEEASYLLERLLSMFEQEDKNYTKLLSIMTIVQRVVEYNKDKYLDCIIKCIKHKNYQGASLLLVRCKFLKSDPLSEREYEILINLNDKQSMILHNQLTAYQAKVSNVTKVNN